jgi:two-component system, NarL family, sensor kinase
MRRMSLLAKFGVLSLVVIALLGVVLANTLRTVIANRGLADARLAAEVAVRVGIQSQLTPEDLDRGVSPSRRRLLDSGVYGGATDAVIARIKVWNRARTIVYSDDPGLVGQTAREQEDLDEAFHGETHAEIVDAGHAEDDPGYAALLARHGELLEVYVPIWFADRASPAGVFELYLPWRPVAAQIARDTRTLYLVLAAGLTLLYAALFRIVAHASGDLQRQLRHNAHLVRRLIQTSEEERARLAAELHDGPVQGLSALGYELHRIARRMDPEVQAGTSAMLDDVQRHLGAEVRQLRTVMTELRPAALDEQGLAAALRDHAASFASQTGVACEVDIAFEGRLAPEHETILFRVAQEALANVAKHANAATTQVVLLERGLGVTLTVADDGVGFAPERMAAFAKRGHFGLVGMRERVEMAGGRWSVRSAPGNGTTVTATLPCQPVPVGNLAAPDQEPGYSRRT